MIKAAKTKLHSVAVGGAAAGISRWLSCLLLYVSYGSMAALAIVVMGLVVARFVARMPLAWLQDIATASMMILVFTAIAELFRRDQHLRVNVFQKRLASSRGRSVIEILITVLCLVFVFVLLRFALKSTLEVYMLQASFPLIRNLPRWPVYALMTLGIFSLSLNMLIYLLGLSGVKLRGQDSQHSNGQNGWLQR